MSTSSTQAPTAGQPIPTPPDFPVVWDDPRDAKLTWMLMTNTENPYTTIGHAVVVAFILGSIAAFEQAGIPLECTHNAHQHLFIPCHRTQSRAAGCGDERHGYAQPCRAGHVQDDDGQDGGRDVEKTVKPTSIPSSKDSSPIGLTKSCRRSNSTSPTLKAATCAA